MVSDMVQSHGSESLTTDIHTHHFEVVSVWTGQLWHPYSSFWGCFWLDWSTVTPACVEPSHYLQQARRSGEEATACSLRQRCWWALSHGTGNLGRGDGCSCTSKMLIDIPLSKLLLPPNHGALLEVLPQTAVLCTNNSSLFWEGLTKGLTALWPSQIVVDSKESSGQAAYITSAVNRAPSHTPPLLPATHTLLLSSKKTWFAGGEQALLTMTSAPFSERICLHFRALVNLLLVSVRGVSLKIILPSVLSMFSLITNDIFLFFLLGMFSLSPFCSVCVVTKYLRSVHSSLTMQIFSLLYSCLSPFPAMKVISHSHQNTI